MKVLGSTTGVPTWGSWKGTEYPQGIWLWRSAGFDDGTSTRTGGTKTLGRHNQNPARTRTQEKGAETPQETEPDLPVCAWESLVEAWVYSGLLWGQGHWLQQLWKGLACWDMSFWRRSALLPLLLPSFDLRPNYREGTQPHPTAENWIKDLLISLWPRG